VEFCFADLLIATRFPHRHEQRRTFGGADRPL